MKIKKGYSSGSIITTLIFAGVFSFSVASAITAGDFLTGEQARDACISGYMGSFPPPSPAMGSDIADFLNDVRSCFNVNCDLMLTSGGMSGAAFLAKMRSLETGLCTEFCPTQRLTERRVAAGTLSCGSGLCLDRVGQCLSTRACGQIITLSGKNTGGGVYEYEDRTCRLSDGYCENAPPYLNCGDAPASPPPDPCPSRPLLARILGIYLNPCDSPPSSAPIPSVGPRVAPLPIDRGAADVKTFSEKKRRNDTKAAVGKIRANATKKAAAVKAENKALKRGGAVGNFFDSLRLR